MANLPIKLSGSYQAPKGDIDALHSFDKRKSDKWGGYMLSGNPPAKYASKIKLDQGKGINQVLLELANQGIKPDVKSIKIKVNADYTVQWEAIIDKSTDGKAYIGVSSRGSGGGGADSRAIGQLPTLQKNNPNCCNWTVVLDFNISKPFNIRQFFIKYTLCKPGEKPNEIKVDGSKSSKNAELTPKNQETDNGTIQDSTKNEEKVVADVTVGTPSVPFQNTALIGDKISTPVRYLDGEYIFNVEDSDYFIHNGDIGSLLIVGKGEIYENTSDNELSDEYIESTFQGSEEIDPEFNQEEAFIIKGLPKVDSADAPESPDELQPIEQQGKDVKFNQGDLKTIKATGKWDGPKVKRLVSGSSWQTRAANFVAKKESGSKATLKAAWDVDHYRMGFGNQKIIKGGKIYEVTGTGPMSTCTPEEAITTLVQEGVPSYAEKIEKDLGKSNWNKLTGNQKAALTSLGYNVGAHYIAGRPYGKRIKQAIADGNMEKAANEILNGPQTAKGKVLTGLVQRRKEEAMLFLLPDNISIYGDGTV